MRLPRLYPILDVGTLEALGIDVETAAGAMLDGGAQILQWRSKHPLTRALFDQTERVAELCRRFGAFWVVNDRADLARMLGAGLHVGQEDLPVSDARRLMGPDALIGLSTHNEEQLSAAAAEPADYLALGPIFATSTKQDPDPVVGLGQLSRWRPLTRRPLVAIGGITRENAAAVLDSGADSVAVIGDLLPRDCTSESLRRRMREWQNLIA